MREATRRGARGDTVAAPCGSWKSPITPDQINLDRLKMWEPRIAGDCIYWIEYCAEQQGARHVMQRNAAGAVRRLTPDGYNVRTRVHEYGGGAYALAGEKLVFVNFDDQRVYAQAGGEAPVPLTPGDAVRYADFAVDLERRRLVCVREDHRAGSYPKNTLVQLSLDGLSAGEILFSGTDFVAFPRISPDSRWIAWVSWDHPSMPWNENALWVAEFDARGQLSNRRRLNVETRDSILDPQWSPDGALYFLSDRSGWWNLYRWQGDRAEPMAPMDAECADPPWELGQHNYAFLGPDRAIIRVQHPEGDRLVTVNLKSRRMGAVASPFVHIEAIAGGDGRAVFAGARADDTLALAATDASGSGCAVIHHPQPLPVDRRFVSLAEAVEFPTLDGRARVHGYWLAPRNPGYQCPTGELPPVIVCAHGGPTFRFNRGFTAAFNFWTSRGVGVLAVNYGGSSGYGREYRERLDGNYGIVDINDTLAAARYVAEAGLGDPARIAVRGSSAGGYIVLGCLAWGEEFAAGINYFGISDVGAWVRDTHKHELHYLDRLVAPYPGNESLYDRRSPIHFVENFKAPLLVLQGAEDKVVPPNQSEFIVGELDRLGKPVAYVVFPGEYHGFSKPASNLRAVNAELCFLGKIFEFTPADPLDPLEIANL